ncbi:MAG TPA: glycosyltransferase family 39 protein [Candidatus Udaeobacter sp.]|nr:glycosyltransferase family 39 protein [Candidatus Udaeobacter sp.]
MGKININARLVWFAWWALAIIVFALVSSIRIRLLGIPLERDEGEYAYAGQLMLQGIPPYKLAYNMKFPGTYAGYALIMSMFGQTIHGIHLGLLLINAATIALIFLIGRRLVDWLAGITAATCYAILSVSPSVLGLAAHATNFVMLPVLAGILLILDSRESQQHAVTRLCVSGLLLGVGLLMKQPAFLFVAFGVSYVVWKDGQARRPFKQIVVRVLAFGIGSVLPMAITSLILWQAGVIDKFWFWTINYAWQYGSIVQLSQAPRLFFESANEVIGPNWGIWALAGIGLAAGLCHRVTRASMTFLITFFLFSALALCVGFYFRYHYFIFILPAVSLLAGSGLSLFGGLFAGRMIFLRLVPLLVFAAALSLPILSQRKVFFETSPIDACRMIYPDSPFPESIKIADYIREHSTPDDTIAVLGSEPQIYFYSKRHSATGYIYTYPLMEPQKYAQQMQEEMIREIERARPRYLVSVLMNDSWLYRPRSDQRLFTWANQYTAANYTVAGFVNIRPMETDYFFGDVPESVESLKNYILIYASKPWAP